MNPAINKVSPVIKMIGASLACGLVTMGLVDRSARGAVLLGLIGPLIAACASWHVVARVQETAPARVSAVMIKLFAAKLLLFAAYVGAMVGLVHVSAIAFVASFTSQYIMLHLMEAMYLQRLFATSGPPAGAN
jgi:hypothetical protein